MSKHSLVRTKIFENTQSLQAQLELWRQNQKKIVFTNGCFDILHRGHVDYLAKAADLGDVLIIGVNTDQSVSTIKGAHRPIQDQESRMQILASLAFVDAVILFGEATPYELIKLVQPDVLVKGSDYQAQNIVGYDIVSAKGGEIKTLDFIPGYSTSAIEAKIKAN
ncbi:MAG: D-glycero-beta-D-manno-heptose 1-phosphate adenylyltransferase [Bacteroidota bacterium]|nr:D-glycero-beta-D-manno-heptose 1-phosphate adenylyltransferase [Bacteroidota bacterium]